MKLIVLNDENDREALATDLDTIRELIRDGYTSGTTERTRWDLSELEA